MKPSRSLQYVAGSLSRCLAIAIARAIARSLIVHCNCTHTSRRSPAFTCLASRRRGGRTRTRSDSDQYHEYPELCFVFFVVHRPPSTVHLDSTVALRSYLAILILFGFQCCPDTNDRRTHTFTFSSPSLCVCTWGCSAFNQPTVCCKCYRYIERERDPARCTPPIHNKHTINHARITISLNKTDLRARITPNEHDFLARFTTENL